MLRANGDRVVEGVTLGRLSNLALWRGEDARALSLARAQLDSAVATQARDRETHALLWLGEVELALGRHGEARQAFEDARARARAIGSPWHHDAAAGVARVALALGDVVAARREVEALLTQLAGIDTLEGMNEPRLIELTCYRVLCAADEGDRGGFMDRARARRRSGAGRDDRRRRPAAGLPPEHPAPPRNHRGVDRLARARRFPTPKLTASTATIAAPNQAACHRRTRRRSARARWRTRSPRPIGLARDGARRCRRELADRPRSSPRATPRPPMSCGNRHCQRHRDHDQSVTDGKQEAARPRQPWQRRL